MAAVLAVPPDCILPAVPVLTKMFRSWCCRRNTSRSESLQILHSGCSLLSASGLISDCNEPHKTYPCMSYVAPRRSVFGSQLFQFIPAALAWPPGHRIYVHVPARGPPRRRGATGTQYRDASSIIKYCNTVYRYIRYTGTDDLRITDLIIRIDHACVNRQNPGRPRCARCCCDFTRTSMPGASHVHLL